MHSESSGEQGLASEDRYRSLFKNVFNGVAHCKVLGDGPAPHDFVFLEVNDAFEALTGIKNVVGKKASEVLPGIRESQVDLLNNCSQVATTGTPHKFDRYFSSLDLWFSVSVYCPEKGHFVAIFDVTHEKRFADALRTSEDRFRNMADTAPVLIWMSGTDAQCNYFNKPWLDFKGRTMEQEVGMGWTQGVHPDDLQRCLETYRLSFNSRQPFSMEYRMRHADGSYRWLIDNGVPLWAADGSFAGFIGSCTEITERIRVEQSLREALAEKETLVKEIHHRVKNNLQVMVSLLAIQSEQVKDARSQRALLDSQERLRSMALIHEQLYQSPDLARIDLRKYVRSLTDGLLAVFGLAGGMRVDVEADELWVGVNTAIPCGMILNELITNAMKHAFPAGRAGRICVEIRDSMAADGVREILLCVSDDGVGLPGGTIPPQPSSLGLKLVYMLARQVGGHVTTQCDHGTRFEVTIRERKGALP